ncbi:MAG: DUF1552 domain-containing protein [Pirellulaceae bacterium]|nr:DUF1552 domain-containing protein [Planctomycetales bacterium]
MSQIRGVNRRVFLRGVGVGLAMPAFSSLPVAPWVRPALAAADGSAGRPVRAAFVYFPNGVNVDRWRVRGLERDFELSESLEPLAPFREALQIFSGLEHRNGFAGPDGAGDHARASSTFLTGARPRKTSGADIHLGVSVDQTAAQHLGHLTRFPSLELSCDGARKSGDCDSGYSCAYQFNISWRSETTPVAAESNPRLAFERLFGAGSAQERAQNLAQRQALQKSLLDFVSEDTKKLNAQLGRNDQRKLDEYLTSIRELERRIERVEKFDVASVPEFDLPEGIPGTYPDHIRVMFDILTIAFQTDSTRIGTFLLAHDGSNRNFPDLNISEGHHDLSHHDNNPEKLEKIAKITRFYVEQLGYFLDRLQNTEDGEGQNLLDNSMVLYGSGLADPNRHDHSHLPVLLAGRGGGQLTPGRHVDVGNSVPMSNLYVSMLNKLGVPATEFGDSTGPLEGV